MAGDSSAVPLHHITPLHADELTEADERWVEELRRYARDTAAATRAAQGLMRESQMVLDI